jgi:sugar/nucleoside kinase (ribokinase family)
MQNAALIRYILAGQLHRDTIITANGQAHVDIPGGNLFYAAAGLGIWDHSAALVARVGEDYPQEWLEKAAQRGFDTRGVRILPASIDLRHFIAYGSEGQVFEDNPVSHFARLGLSFPPHLLGYTIPTPVVDSRTKPTQLTLQAVDLPSDYLDATCAHLCPMDYLSHIVMPSLLRRGNVTTITLDPSSGYMNPTFWDDMPILLNGINAVITSEEKISNLFQGRTVLLWEMIEGLANFGPEIVIVQRSLGGYWLFNKANNSRWIIPAYTTRQVDPTGANDAFCGGYLASYRSSYDPYQAALCGSVSASFTVEGSGPFYPLDAMPGLAQARLNSLKNLLRRV